MSRYATGFISVFAPDTSIETFCDISSPPRDLRLAGSWLRQTNHDTDIQCPLPLRPYAHDRPCAHDE